VLLLASDVIFFSFKCDPIIIRSLSLYIITVFYFKACVVIHVSIKKKKYGKPALSRRFAYFVAPFLAVFQETL
jgi:hypothetical protein